MAWLGGSKVTPQPNSATLGNPPYNSYCTTPIPVDFVSLSYPHPTLGWLDGRRQKAQISVNFSTVASHLLSESGLVCPSPSSPTIATRSGLEVEPADPCRLPTVADFLLCICFIIRFSFVCLASFFSTSWSSASMKSSPVDMDLRLSQKSSSNSTPSSKSFSTENGLCFLFAFMPFLRKENWKEMKRISFAFRSNLVRHSVSSVSGSFLWQTLRHLRLWRMRWILQGTSGQHCAYSANLFSPALLLFSLILLRFQRNNWDLTVVFLFLSPHPCLL